MRYTIYYILTFHTIIHFDKAFKNIIMCTVTKVYYLPHKATEICHPHTIMLKSAFTCPSPSKSTFSCTNMLKCALLCTSKFKDSTSMSNKPLSGLVWSGDSGLVGWLGSGRVGSGVWPGLVLSCFVLFKDCQDLVSFQNESVKAFSI